MSLRRQNSDSKLKYLFLLVMNLVMFTFILQYVLLMGETQYYQKMYSKSFKKDR